MCIGGERGQVAAVWSLKAQPGKRNVGIEGMDLGKSGLAGEVFGEIDERLLEFAAKEALDATGVEDFGGERSIETVGGEMRLRVQFANGREQFQRETRGRVHRKIEGDKASLANGCVGELHSGEVKAGDLMAATAEPGHRRSKPERLAAEFISRNQSDLHSGPL